MKSPFSVLLLLAAGLAAFACAPKPEMIRSRITDAAIIEGNFTMLEVQDLAIVLSSGALTAPATVVEETSGSS